MGFSSNTIETAYTFLTLRKQLSKFSDENNILHEKLEKLNERLIRVETTQQLFERYLLRLSTHQEA